MKAIDVHAHIFPDEIAGRASVSIGDFYYLPMRYDAKVSTLIDLGEKHGIDLFVVHSVATTPEQVISINDFIAQSVREHPDKFIGFATLHADFPNMEQEIDRIIGLGLKGIKIHPDFQCFKIDDRQAFKIYEAIEGRLPLLVHTGDYRFEYSKPSRLAKVMDRFPKLDVIGAHFGGWSEWNLAAKFLAGRRLYVDTSSSLYALTPQRARKLIDLFGVDNVLFGSDYPMWNPGDELDLIDRLDLNDLEKEKILHINAEKLLKI